jgi:hypothetical protein
VRGAAFVTFLGFVIVPLGWVGRAVAESDFQELLFRTPSKNIYCSAFEWNSLTNGIIHCVVLSTGTARLNPKQWDLRAEGRVNIYRPEDAPIANNRVAPYGTILRLGLFRCSSMRSGLKCWSRLSGHGFFLSREQQRTF